MPGPPKKKPAPVSARAALARNSSSVGLSMEQARDALHRPPSPQQQELARARAAQERRYQEITRSSRSYASNARVSRQDGAIAYHAQAGVRAQLKYTVITEHRWQVRAAAANQYAANQTYIRQGSTKDAQQRGRAEAGRQQIAKNLGEQMRASPEVAGIASGVLVGGAMASQVFVPELAVARLMGTARLLGAVRYGALLERGMGLRASYAALRTAPGQFGRAAVGRGLIDIGSQYGANVALGKRWDESWGEINGIETGMAAIGMRPVGISVGSAAFQFSLNNGLQTIFHPATDKDHHVSLPAFMAQAGVGMAFGYGGGYVERRLAGAAASKASARYMYMLHVHSPRWATSAAAVGLHLGQEYGVPLSIGVAEEYNEGLAADQADEWFPPTGGHSPARP